MPKTRESSSPKVTQPPPVTKHPTQEEVALRAYYIYLQRGGAPGSALEDWILAERELHEQYAKSRVKPALKSIAA